MRWGLLGLLGCLRAGGGDLYVYDGPIWVCYDYGNEYYDWDDFMGRLFTVREFGFYAGDIIIPLSISE